MRYTKLMVKALKKKINNKPAHTVSFEPNKMGLAIAILSVVTLVLLAIIVTQF